MTMENATALVTECKRLDSQGLHGKSIRLLTEAISSNPSESDLFYQRGMRYERMGKVKLAFDDYSSALDIAPMVMEYSVSRGRLLCDKLGRAGDAVQDFKVAMVANPDSPVPHQHMSLCYLLLGDTENACTHAERAVELGSDDAFSHFCLGRCRLDTESWSSAIEQLRIATQLDAKSPLYWSTLARSYLGINDVGKARECYQKAVKIRPTPGLYIHLARSQLDDGDPEGAITILNCAKGYDLGEVQRTLVDGCLGIARQERGKLKTSIKK